MPRRSYAKALDERLKPLGFSRSGDDWTRIRGGVRETVNRQSGRLGVTVNLHVVDLETEKLYLEIFGPDGDVEMPPQRERIGRLMGRRDLWWAADEAEGPDELASAVVAHGLPWFDKGRTLKDQAERWYGRAARRWGVSSHGSFDPFTPIALALTLYRLGEIDEACRALNRSFSRKGPPAWNRLVERVHERLGCTALEPQPGWRASQGGPSRSPCSPATSWARRLLGRWTSSS